MTKSAFATLISDEMGLDIVEDDLALSFDELPGWDSVHLLSMLTLLEKHVTKSLSLPDFLEARSLGSIYELVTR
ncbi:acyl carrier protein [Amycolatopsis sp. GM8]|uniref:acyl carrier protein n=1 Tax=Amycolatopsis sp. GM8 TaxID=2896530 RepID=UPI001F40F831|nr:acyl carrier protein [Amycolatopsis sp. GM8]